MSSWYIVRIGMRAMRTIVLIVPQKLLRWRTFTNTTTDDISITNTSKKLTLLMISWQHISSPLINLTIFSSDNIVERNVGDGVDDFDV